MASEFVPVAVDARLVYAPLATAATGPVAPGRLTGRGVGLSANSPVLGWEPSWPSEFSPNV
jgi:hypothetical protein